MKAPNIWHIESLAEHFHSGPKVEIDCRWVPARPVGFSGLRNRLTATWLAFSGRADLIIWTGQ